MEQYRCGHPKTADNTYIERRKNGQGPYTHCRTCRNEQSKKSKSKPIGVAACRRCRAEIVITTMNIRNTGYRYEHQCITGNEWERWRYHNNPKRKQQCNDHSRKTNARRRTGKDARYITIQSVIDRDGAVCYLCLSPVNIGAPNTDPMQATIEHVIPLSRGGEHVWENVRIACRDCNRRKGTKSYDDFRTDTLPDLTAQPDLDIFTPTRVGT